MQFLTEIVIIAVMLGLNAVFAAYEMALAAVSLPRLRAIEPQCGVRASHAIFMKDRMERSLAVVQLGITLAGAVAAATGGAGAEEYFSPRLSAVFGLSAAAADVLSLALIVIPLSAATIVFAELVPKMIALKNAESVVLLLSPAMRMISIVFYPAIWFFESVVKAITGLFRRATPSATDAPAPAATISELLAAASLARGARAIGGMEEHIVRAAATLSSRSIGEIGIPLADVATIPAGSSLADALVAAHLHMHTRYPVTRTADGRTDVVGYVNFKDIVSAVRLHAGEPGIAGIIRPILRLPATRTIAQALELILRGKSHIAMIVGDAGQPVGVVTLEDIVEQLVGDIGDEFDQLLAHIHAHAGSWFVGGGATLAAVHAAMGLPPPAGDVAGCRLAEWFTASGGDEARPGSRVVRNGLDVEVRKVRKRRMTEAVVRHAPKEEGRNG